MSTSRKAATAGRGSYRGVDGRRRAEEERERQDALDKQRREQQNQPFRFRVNAGKTAQFIVVDELPDFHRFEHNIKNPRTGKFDIFTGCTKEWDNCPACQAQGRESYYALYLTVIDLTPFETRNGEKVEFSRKLLVVKPAQQKKFYRAYERMKKDGENMRGALFEVHRDGDKDASIGNDIEYIEHVSEKELKSYTRSWKDQEGKRHTEVCSEVFDYDALFPEPDSDQIRAIVGGEPTAGSRAHEERELGGSSRRASRSRDDDDDDVPATPRGRRARDEDEDEAPARGASRRPSRGKEDPDADGDADDAPPPRSRRARPDPEDEPDDAPPPRRGARAARPDPEDEPPARRTGRTRAVEDEIPEDEVYEPPARSERMGSRTRPAATRGRVAEEDGPPFDTDDDDDAPPPGVRRRAAR